jgi:hypothetical protein
VDVAAPQTYMDVISKSYLSFMEQLGTLFPEVHHGLEFLAKPD